MSLRLRIVVGLVVVVLLGAFGTTAVVLGNGDGNDDDGLRALSTAADALAVPAGATPAYPQAESHDPLSVSRGWNLAGTVDAACATWVEVFRNWVDDPTQQVTGETVPGQSCAFQGHRRDVDGRMQVAVYGAAAPVVTFVVSHG